MFHLRSTAGACALFAIVTIGSAGAEPVLAAAATPEDVGLSSSQLARIEAVVQSAIIN